MKGVTTDSLSPVQQQAFDWFSQTIEIGNIFHCWSDVGRGRTTVLAALHRRLGGKFLQISDFVDAKGKGHPLAFEEALYDVLFEALQQDDVVIVDDFHVATQVMDSCHFYPRAGYLDSPMSVIAAYAMQANKKLIIGTTGRLCQPLSERSYGFSINRFKAEDYEHLCKLFWQDPQLDLDFAKVHRFAPRMNAHQLKLACAWCRRSKISDTDGFIDYLRSQQLTSNVALGEVSEVKLSELKGVEDVVESLEAHIALPLENDELAEEFNLRPKRGVLLVGPPGTGKTTVGRALAHRLKGKFFLVDGTFISGTEQFYGRIHHVFRAATDNAPSVIFIDDSDVIFESGQEHGLYRYLLTMLDGLESESASKVCVMMTAMDVGNLPPALIRSGRIELWLEMRHPDPAARLEILEQEISKVPTPLKDADLERVVQATDGFTGADLKRTVEDGKALHAFDRVAEKSIKAATEYYLAAAVAVSASKEKYARAEAEANLRRPSRPSWFNPCSSYDDYGDDYDE